VNTTQYDDQKNHNESTLMFNSLEKLNPGNMYALDDMLFRE